MNKDGATGPWPVIFAILTGDDDGDFYSVTLAFRQNGDYSL
jgi:hypothetical protein